MSYSGINLDIHTHKIRYIHCKIVNLTKIIFSVTCTAVLYKLGLCEDEVLYKLQLVQPILYILYIYFFRINFSSHFTYYYSSKLAYDTLLTMSCENNFPKVYVTSL